LPKLTYSAHCVLPDGATLLAVTETTVARRWFRTFEVSETRSYVLKAGRWWGVAGVVPLADPRHLRLCEIAMAQQVRRSVDAAFISVS
jgi:hypothetical protein